jgi:hypothetical protein
MTVRDRPKQGGRRYEAALAFESGEDAELEWSGRADKSELRRLAALYDVKGSLVERERAGWLAFHGRPVLGPHGSGRFVLRVEAAADGVEVTAALGEGR